MWLTLIVLWTAAVPAFAQTDIDGTGTSHGFAVSDGDTVKFGKQRVRLFGIDAPEKVQPCALGAPLPTIPHLLQRRYITRRGEKTPILPLPFFPMSDNVT